MMLPCFIARLLASRDRHETLLLKIVDACRVPVWERVRDRLTTLGPVEARGYVRARAMAIVRQQMEREIASPRLRARLYPLVLDRLIDGMLNSPAKVRLRRAA